VTRHIGRQEFTSRPTLLLASYTAYVVFFNILMFLSSILTSSPVADVLHIFLDLLDGIF